MSAARPTPLSRWWPWPNRIWCDAGCSKPGDVLGVVAGTRQASGSTNFMRLHVVTAEEAGAVKHSPRKRASARQKL